MAQYGKNNYFDGVILPEPKEETLRRMAKGVDASQGYLSVASDMGMTGDNLSVVSAFRAPEPNGKAQYVTTLIRDNHRYSLWMETQGHFYCGTGGGSQSLHLGDLAAGTDHLVALCRDGDTLYCYLDGELKGTLGVYDFVAADGFFVGRAAVNQDTLFTSTIYSAKVFNYVLSAAEVSALWNNGDPAGYVLPGYARKMDKSVELGPVTSWTLRGDVTFDSATEEFHLVSDGALTTIIPVDISNTRLIRTDCIYQIRFKIKGSGIITILDGNHPRPEYPFRNITATDEYVQYTVLTSFAGSDTVVFKRQSACDVYIKDISISIVGCVAEYLPGNLIPTAEGSVIQWLDSAPQLPEANGILLPLDASVGGYDLAAVGTPKIIV